MQTHLLENRKARELLLCWGKGAGLHFQSSEKLLEHSQHYRGVMEVVSKHIYMPTRDYVGESGVRQAQEMGEFLPAGRWCLNLRGGEGRGEGVGAAWQDVGMHCVDPGIWLAKSGEWGMHRGDELEWRIEAEHQKQTNEHAYVHSFFTLDCGCHMIGCLKAMPFWLSCNYHGRTWNCELS